MDQESLRLAKHLRAFSALAARPYNIGDDVNWEYNFKAGLDGWFYRLESLDQHRDLVFEWHEAVHRESHEPNTAIMLFCMDSAFECLIYALNALGYAFRPAEFRDITNAQELKRVSPPEVFENRVPGWANVFTTFQRHLAAHSDLLRLVIENHDVTKHRTQGFNGGATKLDPPPGFLERRGLRPGEEDRFLHAPMLQWLVPTRPKLPVDQRPIELAEWIDLGDIYHRYVEFMRAAIRCAAVDVTTNLTLMERDFREPEFTLLHGEHLTMP